MKLGVFDSGLGGLTVVKAIQRFSPQIDICYLGDTARVPYGGKSPETIARYAFECSRFLISQKVDAIVVACNSVSAIALPLLQEQFSVPVYGVIEPGAKAAAKFSRVGLLATVATVNSRAYENALNMHGNATLIACPAPLLVPLVEDGWSLGNQQNIVISEAVAKYISPLVAAKVEVIILGCTHYPILRTTIERELEDMNHLVPLIDSGEELAKEMHARGLLSLNGSGKLELFSTDDPKLFTAVAGSVLGNEIQNIQKVEI